MNVRDNQTFMSLYYEPNAVEFATGDVDPSLPADSWDRETRRLGQVTTPQRIADLMARWVMSSGPKAVLDPAAGLGDLLAACHKLNPRTEFVGVECDTKTLQRAKAMAPRGTKLIRADYLTSEAGIFDGIIANPPYVKAHRLDYSPSDWRYFEERLGTTLDRLTNLYGLFLLKIWEDLAPNGRAAVILPAEFLNANFGEEIKERLVRSIRPPALMVFSPSVSLFSDALTTSAIVLLEKSRPHNAPTVLKRVESVEEAENLVARLCDNAVERVESSCVELSTLNPSDKWLNLVLNGSARIHAARFPKCVGDYFDCSRGIATGANDYFCLTRAELREHHLSDKDVEPCVTKAADVDGLVFTPEKFDVVVARDRRCFLLNPANHSAALRRYLEIGEQLGIPQRHLPSHRPIWYLPENRAVADVLVAVFSRESVKFILNTSGVKSLTCFHGLYSKPGFELLAPLMTAFLNSSNGRISFSRVNRFYGDGLNKLEPKDVEDMPCPVMPQLTQAETNKLISELIGLERLSPAERIGRIDKLAARYFEDAPSARNTRLTAD